MASFLTKLWRKCELKLKDCFKSSVVNIHNSYRKKQFCQFFFFQTKDKCSLWMLSSFKSLLLIDLHPLQRSDLLHIDSYTSKCLRRHKFEDAESGNACQTLKTVLPGKAKQLYVHFVQLNWTKLCEWASRSFAVTFLRVEKCWFASFPQTNSRVRLEFCNITNLTVACC